jgi:hypothetical protein
VHRDIEFQARLVQVVQAVANGTAAFDTAFTVLFWVIARMPVALANDPRE